MEKELVSDLAQYSSISMRFVLMLDEAVLVFPQGVLYPLSSDFGLQPRSNLVLALALLLRGRDQTPSS